MDTLPDSVSLSELCNIPWHDLYPGCKGKGKDKCKDAGSSKGSGDAKDKGNEKTTSKGSGDDKDKGNEKTTKDKEPSDTDSSGSD